MRALFFDVLRSRAFIATVFVSVLGSATASVQTSNDGSFNYVEFAPSEKIYGIDWMSLSRTNCNKLAVDNGQSAATERPYSSSYEIPMGCCKNGNTIYWGKLTSSSTNIAYLLKGYDVYDGYTALAQAPETVTETVTKTVTETVTRDPTPEEINGFVEAAPQWSDAAALAERHAALQVQRVDEACATGSQ